LTFKYAYRDKENVRHESTVVASSKDDAFKKLRAQGLKPFYVELAPGLLNRIQSFGKRGYAIVVLAVLCLALGTVAVVEMRNAGRNARLTPQSEFDQAINSTMRRQPIGDIAVIEKGIRTGWADVFASAGERFLASFAVPGYPPAIRTTTEAEIRKALAPRQLPTTNHQLPTDSLEARQIRAMVEGMKDELRRYLAAGGTIAGYGKRLVRRQEEEIGYYQQAERFVEREANSTKTDAEVSATLEKYNAHLRSMGIRPLTMPERKK